MLALHPFAAVDSARLRFHAATRAVVSMSNPRPAAELRVKELKAELDALGVEWRGIMFDKETLQAAVEVARAAPRSTPAPDPGASQPDATEDSSDSASSAAASAATADTNARSIEDEAAYEEAYNRAFSESMSLKVKELRTELAARSVGWADLFEKEELAARLSDLKVRDNMLCPRRVQLGSGCRPVSLPLCVRLCMPS